MNCPSRVDETLDHDGWNQNPPPLAADLTTRQDLNGLANSTQRRDHKQNQNDDEASSWMARDDSPGNAERDLPAPKTQSDGGAHRPPSDRSHYSARPTAAESRPADLSRGKPSGSLHRKGFIGNMAHVLTKFAKFIGPGFMIAVAYIDPGNYATDVAAGATFRFRLLFIILMSNLFAIFLQSLCIKLGSVTGLNLAEHCKAHLPKWLNIVLYLFAEAAIIATDIAEVGHDQRAALTLCRG